MPTHCNRHTVQIKDIVVNNCVLSRCQEVNYLAVTITSAKYFKLNLQNARHNFFRAVNTIFGRVGLNSSLVTLCSLIDHCCLPILLYASESVNWNKSTLQSFENAYLQVFFKIFNTSDKNTQQCC